MEAQDIDRIAYIESAGNYIVKFYVDGTRDIQRETIKAFENKYCVQSLIRIHKRYIVNLSFVSSKSANKSGFLLDIKRLNKKLKVSRSYAPDVMLKLENRLATIAFARNDPGYLFL